MNEPYLNEPIKGPNDEVLGYLNGALLRRQSVSEEAHSALILSHQLKHVLFEGANRVIAEEKNDVARRLKLRLLAKVFDALETEQQKLWGFSPDPSYHRFFDFPGCSCPKIDNNERLGTGIMIRSLDCEVHGGPPEPPTAEQEALKNLLDSYQKLCANAGMGQGFKDVPSVRAARNLL